MRREHGHSTGRSNVEHPDTAQQHRQEVARLTAEDRRIRVREEEDERRRILVGAAVGDNGHDSYDRAELDYQRMEVEDVGPHPNEWVR
jgi:hypothetical protein